MNTPIRGFRLPSLKSAWNLVYLGQNGDVREILRNTIGGCLEDWELEKTDFHEKPKPRICVFRHHILKKGT